MKRIYLTIVLAAAALSGCATTAPEFCNSDTWHDRGFSHAMGGSEDQSSEAGNDCAAKDAPLAYRMGFDYGLEKFCTYKRGIWAGEMGQGPAESCAAPKWDEYQTGYIYGHKIFEVNARLEAISKELENTRNILWNLETSGQQANSAKVKAKTARIEQLKQQREEASQHLMNLRADTNLPQPEKTPQL
ncbi:MAG: DUF2799 domain-containing protein [Gammaproteobacteria bacterium]